MSLLLIGIAAWGIGFGLISSFRVVGVVIAVGIFLFLIALVGLIGAIKHHQVLLFFVSFDLGSFSNTQPIFHGAICNPISPLYLPQRLLALQLSLNAQSHLKHKEH